jgi:hypothetical protein
MWDLLDLIGGFSVVALPLFVLAVPGAIVTALLLAPLAIIPLAAAVVVLPVLAVRRLLRSR